MLVVEAAGRPWPSVSLSHATSLFSCPSLPACLPTSLPSKQACPALCLASLLLSPRISTTAPQLACLLDYHTLWQPPCSADGGHSHHPIRPCSVLEQGLLVPRQLDNQVMSTPPCSDDVHPIRPGSMWATVSTTPPTCHRLNSTLNPSENL